MTTRTSTRPRSGHRSVALRRDSHRQSVRRHSHRRGGRRRGRCGLFGVRLHQREQRIPVHVRADPRFRPDIAGCASRTRLPRSFPPPCCCVISDSTTPPRKSTPPWNSTSPKTAVGNAPPTKWAATSWLACKLGHVKPITFGSRKRRVDARQEKRGHYVLQLQRRSSIQLQQRFPDLRSPDLGPVHRHDAHSVGVRPGLRRLSWSNSAISA